jgi:hypothetical protein
VFGGFAVVVYGRISCSNAIRIIVIIRRAALESASALRQRIG